MNSQPDNTIELMHYEFKTCGVVFGTPSESSLPESMRRPSLLGSSSFSLIKDKLAKEPASQEIINLRGYIEKFGVMYNHSYKDYKNCMVYYARTHCDQVEFYVKLEEPLTRGLVGMFPNPVLRIKGKVETGPVYPQNDHWSSPYYTSLVDKSLNLKDIFMAMKDKSKGDQLLLLDSSIPSRMLDPLGIVAIKLTLDISVEWTKNHPAPTLIYMGHQGSDAFAKLIETLYKHDETKNVTIVAGNGVEIKCHSFILEEHSSVLAAMLSPCTGMKESQTRKIEIKDMSEAGVDNLLRYLYCQKISTSDLGCDMALELFQAAHKYELKQLEETLRQLFQSSEGWFTPDSALELYYYVGNSEAFNTTLKDHALRVMTRMSPEELRGCQRYQELSSEEKKDLPWKLFDVTAPIYCSGFNGDSGAKNA